jgi:pyruvate formate lyase activating enzyme
VSRASVAGSADAIRIGGLTRFSSVDWPGELVATVFTQGCPWNCPYCHNPHLLGADPAPETGDSPASWPEVLDFLNSRSRLLDGVVFSGGEPLAQPALAAAILEVRALGLRVALHTNGTAPTRLAEVLPSLDWVGFDAKAPFGRYEQITGVVGSGGRARESLALLLASGVAHEVRTTVHSDLLGEEELLALAGELAAMGVARWVLQPYRSEGVRVGLVASAGRPILSARLVSRLAEEISAVDVRE